MEFVSGKILDFFETILPVFSGEDFCVFSDFKNLSPLVYTL